MVKRLAVTAFCESMSMSQMSHVLPAMQLGHRFTHIEEILQRGQCACVVSVVVYSLACCHVSVKAFDILQVLSSLPLVSTWSTAVVSLVVG